MSNLQAIAERINTGAADSTTSRALVVFNQTDQPLSGTAVFHAAMSWPLETPLPPIVVTDFDGNSIPCLVTEFSDGPDRKGRADQRHLAFALRFAVQDVPAQGWRTYIASYAAQPSAETTTWLPSDTPGLLVVETLPHSGDLPPNSA